MCVCVCVLSISLHHWELWDLGWCSILLQTAVHSVDNEERYIFTLKGCTSMYLITYVLWCPARTGAHMRYLDLFLETPPFWMPRILFIFLGFNLWYMWGHTAIANDSDTGVVESHCLSVSNKNPSNLHINKNPRDFFQCGVTWKGISSQCCFGNTIVIFVLSAVPSTPLAGDSNMH